MAELETEVKDVTTNDQSTVTDDAYNELKQTSKGLKESADTADEELMSSVAPKDGVYTTTMDKLEKDAAADEKEELESQPLGPAENTATLDYAKAILEARSMPTEASNLPNKEELWDRYGEEYVDKHKGDEAAAQEEFDEVYKTMSKQYNVQAQDETTTKILDTISYAVFDMDEDFDFVDPGDMLQAELVLQTDSGRAQVLDTWTDATRSTREAAVESKKVIDDEGNEIEFTDDPFDELVDSDKYKSKDGRKIVGFEYQLGDEYSRGAAKLKAIYEGDEPKGEVVSRWDTGEYKWLSKNGLDTSTWKVAVGSIVDIVVDIADTAMSGAEHAANMVSFGTFSDTELYKDLRDARLKLASAKTSTSDRDQQNMVTWNNFVGLGINVALQLAYGRGIAFGMSKLLGVGAKAAAEMNAVRKEWMGVKEALAATKDAEKIATLTKKASNLAGKYLKMEKTFGRKANIVKATSLLAMGAMQAKETGDEALKAGFTPGEAALIYTATLGLQSWANQLSDLGFESLGLNQVQGVIKKTVSNGLRGITPKTANRMTKILYNVGEQGGKVRQTLANMLGSQSKGIGEHALTEAMEEELEFLADEVVRHAATAVSALGYDKDSAPKFQTVMDEGYFDRFMVESAMNMFGGAMGGAMMGGGAALFSKQHVNQVQLPYKGDTDDVLSHIGYYSTRTGEGAQLEDQLMGQANKWYKKGAFGRRDLSTKWNAEEKRHYRMNELSDEDKQKYQSQADVQYKAFIGQYLFYKNLYQNQEGTYDEVRDANAKFANILDSHELYNDTRELVKEKSDIEYESAANDVDMSEQLLELGKMQDDVDEEGNMKKEDKYNEQIDKLASTTKLPRKKLERLIEIEKKLKSIADGTVLEEAFVRIHVNNDPDLDELDYKKIVSLLKSDTYNINKAHDNLAKAKTEESTNSKAVLDAIEKKASLKDVVGLVKPGMYLTTEAKTKLLDYVQNNPEMSAKFIDTKKTILHNMINDLEAAIKKNPDLTLVETMSNPEGVELKFGKDNKTLIESLREAVDNGDSVTDVLSTFNTPDDAVAAKADYLTAGIMEVEATKMQGIMEASYILDKMKDVQNSASVDALGTIKYGPDSLDYSNYDDGFGFGLFDVGTGSRYAHNIVSENTSNLPTVLDKFIKDKDTLNELQNLTSRVKSTQTVDPDKFLARVGHFTTLVKNSDGTLSAGTSTLDEKYNALIATATRDSNGKIKFFADKESAEDLKWQTKVRIQELQFFLKEMDNLFQIRQTNSLLGIEDGPKTVVTTYINDNFMPFEQFVTAPEESIKLINDHIKRLENIYEGANNLIKLAENSNVDLLKVFKEDASYHAKTKTEAIHAWLDRNINSPLSHFKMLSDKDLSVLTEAFGMLNSLDRSKKSEHMTIEEAAAYFDTYDKVATMIRSLMSDPNVKRVIQNSLEVTDATGEVTKKGNSQIAIMLTAPTNLVMKRVKASIESMLKGAKDEDFATMKVPTISQILMAEEVVASTMPDFFKYTQYSDEEKSYQSGSIFQGRQGTGKTSVVAGLAAEVLQQIDPTGKIVLSANNSDQIETLRDSTPDTVKVKGELTQTKLWNALANSTKTAEELADDPSWADVNMIIYDEVSYMEYSGNEEDIVKSKGINSSNAQDIPVLNGILGKLDQINKIRKQRGQRPIIFVGLGDSKQGGFMEGMVSPRNPKGSEELGETMNVLSSNSSGVYVSTNVLTHNFRAHVVELTNAATHLLTKINATASRVPRKPQSKEDKPWNPVRFIHHYDPKEGHTGAQMSSKWDTDVINNDRLVEDIRKKIEATKDKPKDQKFKVIVVAGDSVYDDNGVPADSKLGKLVQEFPDHFKLRGFQEVQGSEADYALIKVSNDFFPFSDADIVSGKTLKNPKSLNNQFDNKLRQLSMAIGRSKFYSIVAMDSPLVSVMDKEGPTSKMNPGDLIEFKKMWTDDLMNKLLKKYDSAEPLPKVPGENTIYKKVPEERDNQVTKEVFTPKVDMILVDKTTGQFYKIIGVEDGGTVLMVETDEKGIEKTNAPVQKLDTAKIEDGTIITKSEYDKIKDNESEKKVTVIPYGPLKLNVVKSKIKVGDVFAVKGLNRGIRLEDLVNNYNDALAEINGLVEDVSGMKIDLREGLSENNLQKLIIALEDMSKSHNLNGDQKEKIKLLHSIAKDIENILAGYEQGEILDTPADSTETAEAKDVDAQEAAKNAERKGELLSYSLSKKGVEQFKSVQIAVTNAENIYGSSVAEPLQVSKTRREILGLKKGESFKQAFDGYEFKVVLSETKPKGRDMFISASIVAVDEHGNVYPISQFSKIEDYNPGHEDESGTHRGKFYNFLKKAAETLKEGPEKNDFVKQNSNGIGNYIEFKVENPDTFFKGVTVGSLATSGESAMEGLSKSNWWQNSDYTKQGGLRQGRFNPDRIAFYGDYKNIVDNTFSKFSGSDSGIFAELERGEDGKSYNFIKYGNYIITAVNTQRGFVPYIKTKDGSWKILVGMNPDGTPITLDPTKADKDLQGPITVMLDKIRFEKSKISNNENYLNPKEVKKVTDKKSVVNMINNMLRIENNDIFNRSAADVTLKNKLLSYRGNYFGDVQIPLNVAIDLWRSQSNDLNLSEPYVLRRGPDAGMTVIFYSFDEDNDFANMSEEQVQQRYDSMVQEMKRTRAKTSIDQKGIGMIMLDPVGRTFNDINKMIKQNILGLSPQLNDMILNGEVEKKLLGMFGVAAKTLFGAENPDIIKAAEHLINYSEMSSDHKTQLSDAIAKLPAENKRGLIFLLENLFSTDKLGKIVLSSDQYEIDYLKEQFELAKEAIVASRGDAAPEGKALLEEAFRELKSNEHTAGLLESNDITDLAALNAITSGGNVASGKLVMSKSTNKALMVKSGPFTIPDVKAFEDLLGPDSKDFIPNPKFDMVKFFMELENIANDISAEIGPVAFETLLNTFDLILAENPAMPKGILMPPETYKSSYSISKAGVTVDENGNAMLTTSVKQIRPPAPVVNSTIDFNDDENTLSPIPNEEAEKKRRKELEERIRKETKDLDNSIKAATTIQDVNKAKRRLNDVINSAASSSIKISDEQVTGWQSILDAKEKMYTEITDKYTSELRNPNNYLPAEIATAKVADTLKNTIIGVAPVADPELIKALAAAIASNVMTDESMFTKDEVESRLIDYLTKAAAAENAISNSNIAHNLANNQAKLEAIRKLSKDSWFKSLTINYDMDPAVLLKGKTATELDMTLGTSFTVTMPHEARVGFLLIGEDAMRKLNDADVQKINRVKAALSKDGGITTLFETSIDAALASYVATEETPYSALVEDLLQVIEQAPSEIQPSLAVSFAEKLTDFIPKALKANKIKSAEELSYIYTMIKDTLTKNKVDFEYVEHGIEPIPPSGFEIKSTEDLLTLLDNTASTIENDADIVSERKNAVKAAVDFIKSLDDKAKTELARIVGSPDPKIELGKEIAKWAMNNGVKGAIDAATVIKGFATLTTQLETTRSQEEITCNL